jgi:hypothetical protein
MSLSQEQIAKLLKLVAQCREDQFDCDGCLRHVAEFAELQLAHRSVPEALLAVQIHLEQCPCCADEYNTLLVALRAMDDGEC